MWLAIAKRLILMDTCDYHKNLMMQIIVAMCISITHYDCYYYYHPVMCGYLGNINCAHYDYMAIASCYSYL